MVMQSLNLGPILSPVIDMQELKQLKVKDQGLELNILPYVCTHVGSGLCIHTVYTLMVPSLSQGQQVAQLWQRDRTHSMISRKRG